jgi:uncharacterized SAM-binding protein YcdF (DUF218 family)
VPGGRVRVRCASALTSACLGLGLSLAGCATTAQGTSLPRDAIVVLGHRPARDEQGVEPELRARTERGIALYREGRAPLLVMTGGRTGGSESEADVMAGLAREAGVPEGALRLEMKSRDTIENAHFTVTALTGELGRAPRVLVVTSDYHVKRAAELFACAGADVQSEGVPLSELSGWRRFSSRLRERAARVVYWFFDECARARGAD